MTHVFRTVTLVCLIGTPAFMFLTGGFWPGIGTGAVAVLIGGAATMLAEWSEA